MQDTIYIKMDKNKTVYDKEAKIGDIASLYSSNEKLLNRIKSIKVMTFNDKKKTRYIISVLYIIKLINEEFPNAEIENIGEMDMLLEYKENNKKNTGKWIEYIKVSFVCIIIFFGSAFAIMTFNTDVNTKDLFSNLYYQFTGMESDGFTVIEAGYSIGLPIGIIVFYNHFGSKKITKDPTPVEVEMRKYEDDINTTLIEGINRKECHKDVN